MSICGRVCDGGDPHGKGPFTFRDEEGTCSGRAMPRRYLPGSATVMHRSLLGGELPGGQCAGLHGLVALQLAHAVGRAQQGS